MRSGILLRITITLIFAAASSMSVMVGIGYAHEALNIPHFHDSTASRSVVENTAEDTNIGNAVSAHSRGTYDRYVLGGTDAASFSIDSDTGQLKTKAALDYETKTSYSVTVIVQRGDINPLSDHVTGPIIDYSDADSIDVTINVTNINLSFSDGSSTTRSIQENSKANTNIGNPVTASNFSSSRDAYVLRGTDASSFSIDSETGQLKTEASLDYEVKELYSVRIDAEANSGVEGSIDVTIEVTNGPDTSCPPGYILSFQTILKPSDCLIATYGQGFGEVDSLPDISSEERMRIAEALALNRVIFNELRNATTDMHDWIELRNVSDADVLVEGWEVHIVTSDGAGTVTLPLGTVLPAGGLLLLLNTDPEAPGMPLSTPEGNVVSVVDTELVLPQTNFTLLLRSPASWEDSVGNYFFGYEIPSTAPPLTTDAAWYRARPDVLGYQAEAWVESGYQDGSGYDTDVPAASALGTPGYPQLSLVGDVNGDGTVNILDLVFVASHFDAPDATAADVNGDGVVNIQDLVLVANSFGSVAAAPSVQTLHASDVQHWVELAKRAVTDRAIQKSVTAQSYTYEQGIQVLEQLLATLAPKSTALLANYPNPFNPETWIPYRLAKGSDVQLRIYDTQGRLVRHLDIGHQAAGVYQTRSRAAYWDGRNEIGEAVASGLYFYTLTAGDFSATRKMLILK